MQTYAEWSPTGFDARGAFLDDRRDWLVAPVIRTRDSGHLETSPRFSRERFVEACETGRCKGMPR